MIKIFLNKICNYFLFKISILNHVIKNGTKVLLLNTGEVGIIIYPTIGTRTVRYSILVNDEKYCRTINHNNIKILK